MVVQKIIGNILGNGKFSGPAGKVLGHDSASKNAMDYNTFYSVVSKSKIQIPTENITVKKIKGRTFAVGAYTANNKKYKAYKILPADFKK